MNPGQPSIARIRGIFCEAQKLPSGDERSSYIDQACADDGSIKAEVLSLLDMADTSDGFLCHDASGSPFFEKLDLSGTRIGNYELLGLIGEGGFGEIYRAKQTQPFQREVALKIIKPGMDSEKIVSSFMAERQALARMNHPNIAQVYDAGTTETGRPYFVMELVRGIPILAYCDDRMLTIRERATLLRQVCAGVQHAHKKGILHRDLKPSNILVSEEDGEPIPKIIDFGVAELLQNQPRNSQTQNEIIIGTPLYMSPELLNRDGSQVNERADIYSLGIILYELVAGVTPLEHKTPTALSITEMREVLREKEMPHPSRRFSTLGRKRAVIACRRNCGVWMLMQKLKGDMDRIVMKAIHAEANRRYEDVLSFDEDLARYLKNEPVSAGNPRIPRRIKKFTQRHKPGFLATVSAIATMVVGAGIMTYSIRFMKEQHDERLKEQAKQFAESVDDSALPDPDHADFIQWNENGHWYKAVNTFGHINWGDAQTAAEEEGGYLATITSADEIAFVRQLIQDEKYWTAGSGPWLGGYQIEHESDPVAGWQWITGEDFKFSCWLESEPNDYGGINESRLHFINPPLMRWNDCANVVSPRIRAFVIEKDSLTSATDPIIKHRSASLIQPPDTHYVALNGQRPIMPYTTWKTAASSIEEAVKFARSGDRILVDNGTYPLQKMIKLNKAVKLCSRNGPEKTIIDAGQQCRAFRIMANDGPAGVWGFTITGGYDRGGTGMWISGNEQVTIENCIITGNRSLDGAGGIAIFDKSQSPSVTIRNCNISNNQSVADGCGIRIYAPLSQSGTVHIVDSMLTNNFTEASGGGISCHALNTTIRIENCLLINNAALAFGGGIHCHGRKDQHSKLEILNCTVLDSRAGKRGGGINAVMERACKNSYRIGNCNIQGNTSKETGGGIRVYTYDGDVMVNRCRVSHNTSGQGGGIMLGTETLMTDSLIYHNEAVSGTGGGIRRGPPGGGTVINCTIAGNRSSESGGGVHISKIINSIVFGNSAPEYPEIMPDTIVINSCSPTLTSATDGNIGLNPMFTNLATGDFRLLPDSPCIDAGSKTDTQTDLADQPRVVDGDDDGKAVVDLGAYEFQRSQH